jgi:hypothetical protein
VYLGVFGMRYGSIDEESGRSITELEYREARRAGLPCMIYLIDESRAPVLPIHVDTCPNQGWPDAVGTSMPSTTATAWATRSLIRYGYSIDSNWAREVRDWLIGSQQLDGGWSAGPHATHSTIGKTKDAVMALSLLGIPVSNDPEHARDPAAPEHDVATGLATSAGWHDTQVSIRRAREWINLIAKQNSHQRNLELPSASSLTASMPAWRA